MTDLDPLLPGDALFFDIESERNAMYLAACLVFERAPLEDRAGALDVDRLVDFIRVQVADQHRYHQVVQRTPFEHRLVWGDADDFDLADHLEPVTLAPGSGERELKDFCARFARTAIDRDRPMWAIAIVEGFAARRFALVIKAHHSLVDGIASIALLQSLLTPRPRHGPPAGSGSTRLRRASWLDRLSSELRHRREATRELARGVLDGLRHPRQVARRAAADAGGWYQVIRDGLHPVSRTPLDQPGSPERCLEWMQTPLARIQEVRQRRGGTLNDVVAATVSLALGRVLEGRGTSRDEQRRMEIRLAVPVNMRDPEDPTQAGNRISMLFAKIPVGESDPLVALDRTRESFARAKASGAAEALGRVLELSEWTPRSLTRWLSRRAMSTRPANLVLTNVPGPSQPLYLLEAELLEIHPIVPLMPGHSLAIAVLSYAGVLDWGLHADPRGVQDPAAWCEQLRVAFEDLHHAATSADLGRHQAASEASVASEAAKASEDLGPPRGVSPDA